MRWRRAAALESPPLEDHREYVGGLWDEIGALQLRFLIERGLQPSDVLLDVACGSLRGGVHFVRYLDVGNYLGIDKEQTLIDRGVELELGAELYETKRPELVVNDSFDFSSFSKRPDVSLAQSLFTHLSTDAIALCLTSLRAFVEPGHSFYATYFDGDSTGNPDRSHDHGRFAYTSAELGMFGARAGWKTDSIGDWGHPRGQKMMLFVSGEEKDGG